MDDSICFPSNTLYNKERHDIHIDSNASIKLRSPDIAGQYHKMKKRENVRSVSLNSPPLSERQKLIIERRKLTANDYAKYINGDTSNNSVSESKQRAISKLNTLIDRLNRLDDNTLNLELLHDELEKNVDKVLEKLGVENKRGNITQRTSTIGTSKALERARERVTSTIKTKLIRERKAAPVITKKKPSIKIFLGLKPDGMSNIEQIYTNVKPVSTNSILKKNSITSTAQMKRSMSAITSKTKEVKKDRGSINSITSTTQMKRPMSAISANIKEVRKEGGSINSSMNTTHMKRPMSSISANIKEVRKEGGSINSSMNTTKMKRPMSAISSNRKEVRKERGSINSSTNTTKTKRPMSSISTNIKEVRKERGSHITNTPRLKNAISNSKKKNLNTETSTRMQKKHKKKKNESPSFTAQDIQSVNIEERKEEYVIDTVAEPLQEKEGSTSRSMTEPADKRIESPSRYITEPVDEKEGSPSRYIPESFEEKEVSPSRSIAVSSLNESLTFCPVCQKSFEEHSEIELDTCIRIQENIEEEREVDISHDAINITNTSVVSENHSLNDSLEICPVCHLYLSEHTEIQLDTCIQAQEGLEKLNQYTSPTLQ